jgi:hypothetical protein
MARNSKRSRRTAKCEAIDVQSESLDRCTRNECYDVDDCKSCLKVGTIWRGKSIERPHHSKSCSTCSVSGPLVTPNGEPGMNSQTRSIVNTAVHYIIVMFVPKLFNLDQRSE